MICQGDPTGYQMMDAATGATAWQSPADTWLVPSGPHLVELNQDFRARRTVDPRTGRTLINLAGWERPTSLESSSPVLLSRDSAAQNRTWLGVLGADDRAVRILGPVPYASRYCQLVPGRIACRIDADRFRVWRHH